MVSISKSNVNSRLDLPQFPYRQGRSPDDTISSIAHLIFKHLENPNAYAHILFIDFSSAFKIGKKKPHIGASSVFTETETDVCFHPYY